MSPFGASASSRYRALPESEVAFGICFHWCRAPRVQYPHCKRPTRRNWRTMLIAYYRERAARGRGRL